MDKIEELKKELEEKKERLAFIEDYLSKVMGLQKEKEELIGFWGNGGTIKLTEQKLNEALLIKKLSKCARFEYTIPLHPEAGHCFIESVSNNFIVAYTINPHTSKSNKIEFRVSDGLEKGTRKNEKWSCKIDVKAAINAFNLHNGRTKE